MERLRTISLFKNTRKAINPMTGIHGVRNSFKDNRPMSGVEKASLVLLGFLALRGALTVPVLINIINDHIR